MPTIDNETLAQYENSGGQDSDALTFEWAMAVATRIGFFDLLPTIVKNSGPDLIH